MQIFSGTANPTLAMQIAAHLKTPLAQAEITRFADGECKVRIKSQIADETVCLIQATSPPVHDNLIELCLFANAFRRAGAKKIIAVLTYFAYARQDLAALKSDESYSAAVFAAILNTSAIDHIITVDLHSAGLQKLLKPTLHNLSTDKLFAQDIQTHNITKPIIVAPDIGAVSRALKVAKQLGTEMAFIAKQRRNSTSKAVTLFGEVMLHNCILLDDIVDSAQTVCNAIQYLKQFGAKQIYVYATHAILSGQAIDRLNAADCAKIMLTNSVQKDLSNFLPNKVRVICLAQLLAQAINALNPDTLDMPHNICNL